MSETKAEAEMRNHDFRPMPQNPQWCAFFGCMKGQKEHARPWEIRETDLGEPYISVSDDCDCSPCVLLRSQRSIVRTDRGSLSLGQLDAHGLARLREIVLGVIDAGDP